jgi:phage shock protein PspC (stress-responsive transcriptional regulator)
MIVSLINSVKLAMVVYACNPSYSEGGDSVASGLRQWQKGHQSYQEASLLGRPAAAQQTWVQRLSPENKGALPYIQFRAGYRNGGVQLVPYIIMLFFLFFGLFIHLFICAYIVWAISPPAPPSPPSPPTLHFQQNQFCPVLQFYWREDISNNKKELCLSQTVFGSLR